MQASQPNTHFRAAYAILNSLGDSQQRMQKLVKSLSYSKTGGGSDGIGEFAEQCQQHFADLIKAGGDKDAIVAGLREAYIAIDEALTIAGAK